MPHITLNSEELTVVVGDNEEGRGDQAQHRAGYNGVWSLSSRHAPENCFVPSLAGLNLEHCMDDLFMREEGGEIFEPRRHPMQLERLSDTAVRLLQESTPLTGVASETTFALRQRHSIDMTFRATLQRPPRAGQRFGFFWASYINAPQWPGLQFIDDRDTWSALSPDAHGKGGGNSVCHASLDEPTWGDGGTGYNAGSLAHSISQRRFSTPLMFGRPGDGSMLYLQLFDQQAPVRLCMSPTGGGHNPDKRLYNPAWDFQYIIDRASAGTTCTLRSRLIYKPYVDRGEIEELYRQWQDEL
ncbi:MAG: hypothetical protein GKR89_06965 [Candidatus Latescibacteria bacterium]|nr:hypothetical protein [Candidatus Latescibacterota bacterium]